MPKNINCTTIIISLKGNIRHKNNKTDCKQSLSRQLHLFRCTINNKLSRGKKTKTLLKIQKEESKIPHYKLRSDSLVRKKRISFVDDKKTILYSI